MFKQHLIAEQYNDRVTFTSKDRRYSYNFCDKLWLILSQMILLNTFEHCQDIYPESVMNALIKLRTNNVFIQCSFFSNWFATV